MKVELEVARISLFPLLALWGNKNGLPSMKVKKLVKFQNKMGLKGCKWSSLKAPGTQTSLSHSLFELAYLPFLSISPLGVISNGRPVWKCNKWKIMLCLVACKYYVDSRLRRTAKRDFPCDWSPYSDLLTLLPKAMIYWWSVRVTVCLHWHLPRFQSLSQSLVTVPDWACTYLFPRPRLAGRQLDEEASRKFKRNSFE